MSIIYVNKMKEMNNENIDHFIGLCIDIPNIFYLMEFCSKGSLQVSDVMHIYMTSHCL